MRETNNPRDGYWFTWDAEDVADKLMQHHHTFCTAGYNPVWQMWQRNTYAYYSTVLDADSWFTSLQFTGEQGELVKMSVPQARSLIRQLLTLITKQKIAFNAVAEIENSAVTDEVRIANALSSNIVDNHGIDVKNARMVEQGLVVGTGFMKWTWRTDHGQPIAADEANRIVYDGDLEVTTPDVSDVIYNYQVEEWKNQEWVECRVLRNRWTMIAQHPELEVEITKLPSANNDYKTTKYQGFDDNDQIYVYEAYHKPTPALPRGRMVVYSNTKTIYFDDVNPYGGIPIVQYKPEPIVKLGYGYPMLSNLLPAQEMYDHEFSCVATNHSALGVQNIAVPRGGDVNVEELYGLNFMYYTPQNIPGGGKPEALSLLKDSPDTSHFQQSLLGNMQQIANINSAVRGEVSEGTSGVAIATLTTNALEFLSDYSKAMNACLEEGMMMGMNAYRRFAKSDRLVSMAGKNYQSFTKKFSGADLMPIKQMKLQLTNPLMQTIAGRVDVATNALKTGLITNMQEYASILDGQPLSALYEADTSQNDLIQSENERLMSSEPVAALSIDNHALHILKHRTLLNDPLIRLNSAVVNQIMAHILDHSDKQQQTDPIIMAMANTGKAPQGMPAPAGQAPQQVQGQPHPQLPPGGQGGGGAEPHASPAMQQAEDGGGKKLGKAAQPQVADENKQANPAQPAHDLLGRG